MVKSGFWGERKRILTPSLSQGEGECGDGEDENNVVKMSPFSHTQLSLATFKGECGDGKGEKMTSDKRRMTKKMWWKSLAVHIPSCRWLPQWGGMWRVIYLVSPRTPEGGQAGKGDKHLSLHILCSCGVHTQLSLATSMRGNVVTEKGKKWRVTNDEGASDWKERM